MTPGRRPAAQEAGRATDSKGLPRAVLPEPGAGPAPARSAPEEWRQRRSSTAAAATAGECARSWARKDVCQLRIPRRLPARGRRRRATFFRTGWRALARRPRCTVLERPSPAVKSTFHISVHSSLISVLPVHYQQLPGFTLPIEVVRPCVSLRLLRLLLLVRGGDLVEGGDGAAELADEVFKLARAAVGVGDGGFRPLGHVAALDL